MFGGEPSVFYGTISDHQRISSKLGGSWYAATYDGDGSQTGQVDHFLETRPSATEFGNQLNSFYLDGTNNTLRRAHGTIVGFSTSQVTSVGSGQNAQLAMPNASITFGGKMYVFYSEKEGTVAPSIHPGVLRVGVFDGTTWTFSVLDGDSTVGGRAVGTMQTPAVVVDTNNNIIRLYYHDKWNCTLREATTSNGSSWSFAVLDGNSTVNGRINTCTGDAPSAVFDPTVGVRVFSYDVNGQNLRVAALSGTTWSFATVDGNSTTGGHINGNVGSFSAALIDENGVPNVFYLDGENAALRTAWFNGLGWSVANMDGGGSITHACSGASNDPLDFIEGWVSAVEDPVHNRRHVFYSNGQWQVRHAEFTP